MTALNPNHPAFDLYRRLVAGQKVALREGEPAAGFWHYKTRSTNTIAVIMPDRNEAPWSLICHVGPERRVMEALEVWSYVAGRFVKPDVAKSVLETGQWPDAAPDVGPIQVLTKKDAVDHHLPKVGQPELLGPVALGVDLAANPPQAKGSVIGDNAEKAGVGPVDEALAYLEVADTFLQSLGGKIEDDLTANKAANCRDRLASFSGDKGTLKTAHTEEKRPHLEKCREIDEKYLRLIDRLKEKYAAIGRPLEAYMKAKQAAADAAAAAERKRLEEEAAAKQQKAIEEAKARNDEETAKQIAAIPVEALVTVTPAATAAASKVKVGGQLSGRKTTLKPAITYVIEDYDKVLAAVKDQTDVREAVQKAVNRLMKAGVAIPGAKKVEGTKL